MVEMGGEAAAQAGIVDEKVRGILAAVEQAATDTSGTATNTLRTMVTNYQSSLATAVGEVGKLRAAIENIPTDINTLHTIYTNEINLATGETKGSPPPGVAGVYYGGYRQPEGYQYGGSFRVGGLGGPDSQLVQFLASPGEQVTVSPPGRTPEGIDYD